MVIELSVDELISAGKIDFDEFVAGMKKNKLGLTKQQYYDLFSSLDVHKNGSIEIKVLFA